MPELVKNIQFDVESFFDFLFRSVLASLLEDNPEFFIDLSDVVRGIEDV